jgi:hypothetical protein
MRHLKTTSFQCDITLSLTHIFFSVCSAGLRRANVSAQ